MNRQFIMTYTDYVNEFNDLHEAFLLSLLEDRMRSSLQRPQFTDNDGTFVMFTIEEIMDRVKVGRNKAINLLASLVNRGYVVKKRLFNATKLYLPKFVNETNESPENKPVKVCKSNSKQSHLNKQTNQRLVTSHTSDATETRVEKWKQAVTGKSKIPVLAVEKILDYTNNDVKRAYAIIGLINKAKYNVARVNHLGNSKVTRYESNANISSGLPARLVHIFNYARKAKDESAYLMNALKTFFRDAFGIVKDEIVKPVAKSDKPVNQPVQPSWMIGAYDDLDNEKVSDTEKAEIERMLKRFE